jgi:hypothetical protein
MMRFSITWMLSLLLLSGLVTAADEPSLNARTQSNNRAIDENVLAKFPVARHGDVLTIPVVIGETKYQFLLDTGSVTNVLDESIFRRVQPLRRVRGVYPSGGPPIYQMPAARLDSADIDVTGDTAVVDLKELRHLSGLEIHGFLGMTFLKDLVLELDFDGGSVAFLKHAPQIERRSMSLTQDRFHRPLIDVEITPQQRIPFLIDTGMATPGVGEVSSSVFDELLTADRLGLLTARTNTLTVSGTTTNRKAQLDVFKLGDFEHHNLRVSGGSINGLGLRYLSRFKVTLDLANDRAWFEPGQRYGALPTFDASGLAIARRYDQTMIDRVFPDSPASEAGLEKGDVITHFNGRSVESDSLFILRLALCKIDAPLDITYQRKGEQHTCRITLTNWQHAVLK